MTPDQKSVVILVAEDDPEDCQFIKEAFMEGASANRLQFVEDGEQLMDYLYQRGRYAEHSAAPEPGIVLLDLNMPKKDGLEALREIKSDPNLKRIPVVVLTTSREEEDILRSYDYGANSYIAKPVTFGQLVNALKSFGSYWLDTVALPGRGKVS